MHCFQPIMKLTNLCNLDCSYCYYKQTLHTPGISKLMSKDVWKNVVDKTFEYNFNKQYYGVDFCLHGGEPSLYPINQLREFIEYVKEVAKKYENKVSYSFSLQSNGIHFSDELLKLCKEENINVGISMDGPKYINEVGRKSLSFTDVTERSLQTIKKLQENNIKFGVLTVISDMHKGKEQELYDFYKENEIHSVGFLRCFSDYSKIDNDVLANFLINFFDLYFYGSYKLTIREFDYAIQNALGIEAGNVCNLNFRKNCGCYLTVSTDGDLYFCDDNISNMTPYGNIVKDNLEDIYQTTEFKNKLEKIHKVKTDCEKCEVYNLCRMGCHRNDIDGHNYFCKAYKEFYKHVQNIVNQYKKEVETDERS